MSNYALVKMASLKMLLYGMALETFSMIILL